MNLIHLEFQGKSTRVVLSSVSPARPKPHMTQKTAAGEVSRMRVLNGLNLLLDPMKLTAKDVISADAEISPQEAGRKVDADLSAAYFNPADPARKPIGDFKEIDVIYDAQGQEKERRAHLIRTPNLNTLHPIKLGKRFPVAEALTQFVFRHSYQLVHQDGLTMDFLFNLAKDLHEKKEVAFVGAGPKGNQPLIAKEKGSPYRAFLYGEVGSGNQAKEYRLVLLLSDQELKKPTATAS